MKYYLYIFVLMLSIYNACRPINSLLQRVQGRDVLTYMDVNNGKKYNFALKQVEPSSVGIKNNHFATQLIPMQKNNGDVWYFMTQDSADIYFVWDTVRHLIGMSAMRNGSTCHFNDYYNHPKHKMPSGQYGANNYYINNYFLILDTIPNWVMDNRKQGIFIPYPQERMDFQSLRITPLLKSALPSYRQDWIVEYKWVRDKEGKMIGEYFKGMDATERCFFRGDSAVSCLCQAYIGHTYMFEYLHNIAPLSLYIARGINGNSQELFNINIRLLRINGIRLDKMIGGYKDKAHRNLPKGYAFFK